MSKSEETVNSVSRISAGTSLVGEMQSANDIRVDGNFEGRICSKGRIVIGESADVKGTVICSSMDLWGRMSGDVYVREVLSLKGGSGMIGNVNTRKFIVELGASFDGTCKMISEEEFQKISSQVRQPVQEQTVEPVQNSRKK